MFQSHIFIYIPGFSIGLGMASHGHQEAGVPMTYSGAGHVAQPKTKLSHLKTNFQFHPIETNEETQQKLKLDRANSFGKIWNIVQRLFQIYIGLGMASHGQVPWHIPGPAM